MPRGLILIVIIIGLLVWAIVRNINNTQQPINQPVQTEIQDDRGQNPGEQTDTNMSNNLVKITTSGFDPVNFTIKNGATVSWINQDSKNHSVAGASGTFNSGDLANNQIFQFAFNQNGTYDYFCSIHPEETGSIIVK